VKGRPGVVLRFRGYFVQAHHTWGHYCWLCARRLESAIASVSGRTRHFMSGCSPRGLLSYKPHRASCVLSMKTWTAGACIAKPYVERPKNSLFYLDLLSIMGGGGLRDTLQKATSGRRSMSKPTRFFLRNAVRLVWRVCCVSDGCSKAWMFGSATSRNMVCVTT